MSRLLNAVLFASWLLAAAPSTAVASSADERLAAFAIRHYRAEWEFSPQRATGDGVHDYDTRLSPVMPDAIAARVRQLHGELAELATMDANALTLNGQVDRQLLESAIKSSLFNLEARPQWKINPSYYVNLGSQSVFTIMARDFAPLPQRMRLVTAREQQIPAMLKQAERNLAPSSTPVIAAKVGQLNASGAADFLSHDVAEAFAAAGSGADKKAFTDANDAAAAAYRAYAAFIKTKVAPHAGAPYAIGPAAYSYLEQLQNVVDIPLPKLLAVGEANLARDKAAFIATAKQIDPAKTPEQVADELKADHPAAGNLLPTAQNDLKALVDFIKAKRIIDLPEAPLARVVPTPPFERQFTFASMDTPGPLETKATEAYYNVTPVDPSWTATQAREHLEFFNRYQIMNVSAHETYPGHYVNYLFNKREHLSLVRQLEWNDAFGEGWAHYDEQMMVEQGMGGGDPRYRLAQLSAALTRDGRYVVGIKEHTQAMTIDEATTFLMDNAFMGREPAYREAVRGTGDPLYGYYTLGKLMLLKLRDDYRAKMGPKFSLRQFHDALLSHGDPPIYYLRKLLLGEDDNGSLL